MKKHLLIAALVLSVSGCENVSAYNPWQRNVVVMPTAAPAAEDAQTLVIAPAAPAAQPVPVVVADEVIAPAAPAQKRASLIIDDTVAANSATFAPPQMHMHQCMPEALAPQIAARMALLNKLPCAQRQLSSVDVSFQYGTADVSLLSKEIDARIVAIRNQAKKLGINTVELTELNYNINNDRRPDPFHHNDDADYSVGGRMRFSVSPVDKAPALVQWLSGNKDYRVNLNTRVAGGPCAAAQ